MEDRLSNVSNPPQIVDADDGVGGSAVPYGPMRRSRSNSGHGCTQRQLADVLQEVAALRAAHGSFETTAGAIVAQLKGVLGEIRQEQSEFRERQELLISGARDEFERQRAELLEAQQRGRETREAVQQMGQHLLGHDDLRAQVASTIAGLGQAVNMATATAAESRVKGACCTCGKWHGGEAVGGASKRYVHENWSCIGAPTTW